MDNVRKSQAATEVGILATTTIGLLTAFGPFVTDFYLPSMPEMVEFFKTGSSAVSASLACGMLGLSLGQLLIGPLSDKYGRKPMLLMSLGIFILASLCCIFAKDISFFNVMRIFQGLGGAGGIVLSKSMCSDMFQGAALAKFMAIVGTINGIAPIAAPVLGGILAGIFSWQYIFACLLALGIILFIMSSLLKESLGEERRSKGSVANDYRKLLWVFKNPVYRVTLFCALTFMAVFFAYVSSSTFIIQNLYGCSPVVFSLCFALNAVLMAVGCAVTTRFRTVPDSIMTGGTSLLIGAVCTSFILLTHGPFWALEASLCIFLFGFGLLQPGPMAYALDCERDNAGSASAIYGAGGFLMGAIVSPVVSSGNIILPTSIVIVTGSALCLVFCRLLCRKVS